MTTLSSILLMVVVGVLGALLSKVINSGGLPWWCILLTSTPTGLVWGWMLRQKGASLVYLSTLHDVTIAIVYALVFWLLGESLGILQVLGILLAVVGTILVNGKG